MTCRDCGGRMVGDGFTGGRHCEEADDSLYWDKGPDASPVGGRRDMDRERAEPLGILGDARARVDANPSSGDCVQRMANATKDVPVSLRLTHQEADELVSLAALRHEKPASIGARFVREGVRRARFPAIEFRDGDPARVAYLAGTRWPVWMIVSLVEELGQDLERAAEQLQRPAALVRLALAYAAAYPEEIKAARDLAARRDFEGLQRLVPNLEQL